MNNVLTIRRRLGLSQADFGAAIGVSQGNVSHYEQMRQEVPPHVARQIIDTAAKRGLQLTFDDIYGDETVSTLQRSDVPGGMTARSKPRPLRRCTQGANTTQQTGEAESTAELAAIDAAGRDDGLRTGADAA